MPDRNIPHWLSRLTFDSSITYTPDNSYIFPLPVDLGSW
jgi:hypothetical protein